jgi:hypothetical protein
MSFIKDILHRKQDMHPPNQHKVACYWAKSWQVMIKSITFLCSYTHGSFVLCRCPNTEWEASEKKGVLPNCTLSNCCRSREIILVSTALHNPGSESGAEEMGRRKKSINKIYNMPRWRNFLWKWGEKITNKCFLQIVEVEGFFEWKVMNSNQLVKLWCFINLLN